MLARCAVLNSYGPSSARRLTVMLDLALAVALAEPSASRRQPCPLCGKPLGAFGASVMFQEGFSTICFVHADDTRCARTDAADRSDS
jgi:hypothetical protein